jgi:predicted TIM-barrel fold metal-dependent hydrolase
VVFPLAPELYFDLPALLEKGEAVPAESPLSPQPYAVENRQLMSEVFRFCPEFKDRFITFVSADPGRDIAGQIEALTALEEEYPIYGIKISPVLCQSPVTELLGRSKGLVEFALERNIPMLIHSTVDPSEQYSQVSDILRVAETYPDQRVCLAHCAGFDWEYLQRADRMSNVWVDTSALKIQVQMTHELSPIMALPNRRFEADYSNHISVMQSLVEAFPDTILWGSDSPAYSYICLRQQADGVQHEFRLKANYEDEVQALDSLSEENRLTVSNTNTLKFLFGRQYGY